MLEVENYYLFLLAKAVGEGWSHGFGDTKRSFLMARGMTAGGQRFSVKRIDLISRKDHETYVHSVGGLCRLSHRRVLARRWVVHPGPQPRSSARAGAVAAAASRKSRVGSS